MNRTLAAAAQAPTEPGVYVFLDPAGDVLYIGTAGNLRRRLKQHGIAGPATSHLHHRYDLVDDVRWQVLPSAEAAAWREADLIFALQPPFNAESSTGGRRRMLTTAWPAAFLAVARDRTRWRFTLQRDLPSTPARAYGCFPHLGKGVATRLGIACSDGYVAFLRLLWAASGNGDQVPTRITRSAPDVFEVAVDAARARAVHDFLAGTSVRVLADLASQAAEVRPRYMGPALARDADLALRFFTAGPRWLHDHRRRHRLGPAPVTPDQYRQLIAADFRARMPSGASAGRA